MFTNGSVTIIIDDLKKAEQFYVKTLGLKVQHRIEGHLLQVESPGLTIGLLHPREGQDSHPGKSGNIHIALEVKEFDLVIKVLKSRGVEFHSIREEEATRIAYFSDPEGNLIYIIQLNFND